MAVAPLVSDPIAETSNRIGPNDTVVANNNSIGSCDTIVATDRTSHVTAFDISITDTTSDSNDSVVVNENVIGVAQSLATNHNMDTDVVQSEYKERKFGNEREAKNYHDPGDSKHQTIPVTTKVESLRTNTYATSKTEDQLRSEASAENFCNSVVETGNEQEPIISVTETSMQCDQLENIEHQLLAIAAERKAAVINTVATTVSEGGQHESEVTMGNLHNNGTSVLQDVTEGRASQMNAGTEINNAAAGSFSYPECVREVSAALQEARCSSPPYTSPPQPTPPLAAVAASSSHSCGSLYAQCGANHHETVSLNEILIEREHIPSYYRYTLDAIDSQSQDSLEEDEETLLKDYHKQQRRFLMGNGVSSGPCAATPSNTALTTGNLQSAGNGQIQKTSPTGASSVLRVSQPEDYDYLMVLVPQLKREAKDWEAKSDSLETEVLELRKELRMREQEVIRLQREVHKLRVSDTHLSH
jgi:hypothetical protein